MEKCSYPLGIKDEILLFVKNILKSSWVLFFCFFFQLYVLLFFCIWDQKQPRTPHCYRWASSKHLVSKAWRTGGGLCDMFHFWWIRQNWNSLCVCVCVLKFKLPKPNIPVSYILTAHVILYGFQCLSSMRNSLSTGVRKNRTPCSSLTVKVLAWLLINWHCACHTRHLVGRRPLWHQYTSSSEAQLGGIQFYGQVCYIAPCSTPAINLLMLHFGNCWDLSLIRGGVWRGVCCGFCQHQHLYVTHNTFIAEGSIAAYGNNWCINHSY